MTNQINVHTDGSCLGNGRVDAKGGWGVLITNRIKERCISGSAQGTTNQQMELTAAIEGLSAVKNTQATICLHSDSQYVVRGCNEWLEGWKAKGWRGSNKKPIKNLELWQTMDEQLQRFTGLSFQWVKGHSGNPENERVDRLATDASNGHTVDEYRSL